MVRDAIRHIEVDYITPVDLSPVVNRVKTERHSQAFFAMTRRAGRSIWSLRTDAGPGNIIRSVTEELNDMQSEETKRKRLSLEAFLANRNRQLLRALTDRRRPQGQVI